MNEINEAIRNARREIDAMFGLSPEQTTMTTATYRKLALEAENRLDWAEARKFWNLAILHYPTTGALADRDKAAMARRRDDCCWY